jgi:hypothetical protein
MERFIERQNIAKFTSQLQAETDPVKRATLQSLLKAEEAKLAAHDRGK